MVVAIGALVFAWLATAVAVRVIHAGEVLPGTYVEGVALGGASAAESRRRLGAIATDDRVVNLVDRGRRFSIRAGEVGFRLDRDATTRAAMTAGRRGPLAGVVSTVVALVRTRSVAPIYAARPRRVRAAVSQIAEEVDRPPFPGDLAISAKTLRVSVIPPRPARLVQRPRTERMVLAALRRDDRAPAKLPTRTVPGVSLSQVESVAERARDYLDGRLRLSGAGRPLALAPRKVASVLRVEAIDGSSPPRVRLGADPRRLATLVEELAARRDRPAVDARILAPAAPVVVDEKLDLSWRPRRARVRVRPARRGRRVQQAQAAAAIAEAIREGVHTARLPIRVVPAALTTGAVRRARFVIGTFTTRFECCQPRVRNIELIARAVDGTVIPAGGQFALNRVAGRRTRARGYVRAPFIADGKLVPSVGGGVSQLATTAYNAAYFAGLDIDVHQPHSFYIDRYPPGREATLDYPSIDLAWTNDTSAPVLVRATTTPESVTVTLYGDNGGRRVRAESGPRERLPGQDFSITVTRVIRYPGGRVARQSFITRYDEPPAGD